LGGGALNTPLIVSIAIFYTVFELFNVK